MGILGYHDIEPGGSFLFHTGFAQAIPEGYVCLLWDRGGMGAVKCVHRLAGVIGEDYRGEWLVRLVNRGSKPVRINVGDKIVQGIYQEYAIANCPVVDILTDTERGTGVFGSTDKPAEPKPAYIVKGFKPLLGTPCGSSTHTPCGSSTQMAGTRDRTRCGCGACACV